METFVNRIQVPLTTAPGASGPFLIGVPTAGLATFSAAQNTRDFAVTVTEGTAWEIRRGCVYTHAGTALSRGTFESSSTGAPISFTSAAVLMVTLTAGQMAEVMSRIQALEVFVAGATALPANTVLPVISGTVSIGQTLSTTNGTWSGAPGVYSYQWRRGGVAVSGATSATYLLSSADLGAQLSVVVTSTNINGATSATSASTTTLSVDTRPRFGYATALLAGDTSGLASLFNSMTPLTGSASSGTTGTFNTVSSTTNFTWLAVLASAAGVNIRVFDGTGYGGFSGAGATNNYVGSEIDPTTIALTYTDVFGNLWNMYRSDGKAVTYSTFTLS